jgi:hypothetical protein
MSVNYNKSESNGVIRNLVWGGGAIGFIKICTSYTVTPSPHQNKIFNNFNFNNNNNNNNNNSNRNNNNNDNNHIITL